MIRFKHFILPGLVIAWEHWLTVKFEQSTVGLLKWGLARYFRKGKTMTPQDDIKLGTVGDLVLGFSAGKASVTAKAAIDNNAVQISASVQVDSSVFIDQLFAAIEKASPPGTVAIEESVKSIIKSAIAAIQ